MPGINIVFNKRKGNLLLDDCSKALNYEIYPEIEITKIRFVDQNIFLGFKGFPNYPIYEQENERFKFFVEGHVYNKQMSTVFAEIANIFSEPISKKVLLNNLSNWLKVTDGEFIFCLLHKESKIFYVFNDIFARLPLYYAKNDNVLTIAREQQFIRNIIASCRPDIIGSTEFMVFGYTIGHRTLIEGIHYVQPGTLFIIDSQNRASEMVGVHTFNFQDLLNKNISLRQASKNLTEFLMTGCKNRLNVYSKNVVGLSGGLDSRSVLAAATKSNPKNLTAVSRLSSSHSERKDVQLAEKIASVLRVPWEKIDTRAVTGGDLDRLNKMKCGLNSLQMGFNLNYEEALWNKFGSDFNYLTGDGGDRIKPHLKRNTNLKCLDDLVEYIITANQVMSAECACKLMGLSLDKFKQEVAEYAKSCPERSLDAKYLHFHIYESAFKYVFEGEDRKRKFFWTTTPFYSTPFFFLALSLPEDYRQKLRLYKYFLNALSPEVAGIANADWDLPITSSRLKYYFWAKSIYNKLPQKAKSILKTWFRTEGRHHHCESLVDTIDTLVSKTDRLSEYVEIESVKKFIGNVEKYNTAEIYHLLTILVVIESLLGNSILENVFANREFL